MSMMLFGNGDGGGGATLAHLASLDRLQDIDGLPVVKQTNPTAFFDELRRQDSERPLCTWEGELYLELHQVRHPLLQPGRRDVFAISMPLRPH